MATYSLLPASLLQPPGDSQGTAGSCSPSCPLARGAADALVCGLRAGDTSQADAAPRSGVVPGLAAASVPAAARGSACCCQRCQAVTPCPGAGLGAHTWSGARRGLAAGSAVQGRLSGALRGPSATERLQLLRWISADKEGALDTAGIQLADDAEPGGVPLFSSCGA